MKAAFFFASLGSWMMVCYLLGWDIECNLLAFSVGWLVFDNLRSTK